MGTKLRKRMFPGENKIHTDAVNQEARKIIEKFLMLTRGERIIT